MIPAEFKSWQLAMGFTTTHAAAMLGISARTVNSYRQGTRGIPEPTVKLMMLLQEKYHENQSDAHSPSS